MIPPTRHSGFVRGLAVVVLAAFSVSCATSRIVGNNAQRVVNGQSLDTTGLGDALAADGKDLQSNLAVLKRKFLEAMTKLRANVQKRWGQNDTKVADRTNYVKYTQNYKTRVVTDFDHGILTVETVDEGDPQASLKGALIAVLLTSSDPTTVDVFSDKDVTLDARRKPFLYDLVHDNKGKAIRTREQAEAYAQYLIPLKVQSRPVSGDDGAKTARFVRLTMVRNFEAKGADRYRPVVDKYAAQYQVSPTLVLAIIRTESNFNPFAVSSAPAYGLMQLVPTSGGREAYKRVAGVDQAPTAEYLLDPEHSIELGAAYLGVLSNTEFKQIENPQSRDYCVIAPYNTGARNVTRVFANDRAGALAAINHADGPTVYEALRTRLPFEETRVYVTRVTGYRKDFVAAEPGATK